MSKERKMKMDAEDNITVINTENDNEVIAVISEKEVIVKEGFEVLFDVGVDDK